MTTATSIETAPHRSSPPRRGLRRRLATVAPRTWVAAGVTWLAVAGGAAIYVATAERTYEAGVRLLVSPLPGDEQRFEVGLLTESIDPTLEVQTATGLARRPAVAEMAARDVGGVEANALLDDISAASLGKSNTIEVTVADPSAERAADLANAVGRAVVTVQDAELRRRIDDALAQLTTRAAAADAGELSEIEEQIAWLESLRETGDPTLSLFSAAEPPASAVRPRPALTLALGIVGGLVLAGVVGIVTALIDDRVRREDQIEEVYDLPILARVAKPRRRRSTVRVRWGDLPETSRSGYRRLRSIVALAPTSTVGGHSILLTGPTSAAERGTVALHLAHALRLSGSNTVVVATDRDPGLASNTREVYLEPRAHRAGTIIRQLQEQSEFVIVTTPAANEMADWLPLTGLVDSVIVVVSLGGSRVSAVRALAEILDLNGVRPTGLLLVGAGGRPPY